MPRVYMPSVAPACITGMTGMFAPVFRDKRFETRQQRRLSVDGGLAIGGSMTVTFTCSPASVRMTASTSCADNSRQYAAIDDGARELR